MTARVTVRVLPKLVTLLTMIACAGVLGCGGEDKPATEPPPGPPPAVVDSISPAVPVLIMSNALIPGGVVVSWDAVGDDAMTGRADHYVLHHALSAEADSAQRTGGPLEMTPKEPRERESTFVSGLEHHRDYWFWLKVYDEAGNHSESAAARGRTAAGCTPPDSVADLGVSDSSATALRLHWTFPDSRAGDRYELRRSGHPITLESWNTAWIIESGAVDPSNPAHSALIAPLTPRSYTYFGVRSTRNCWSGLSVLAARTTGIDAPGWHGMPEMLSPLEGSPVVTTAAVFRDRLYVGGKFSLGSGSGCCLAQWGGAAWAPVSDLTTFFPLLLQFQDKLWIGNGDKIMAWDEAEMTTIGRAAGSAVSFAGLVEYHGSLVVAGSFSSVDGELAAGLARWDGSSWMGVPVMGNQGITAAVVYNDELVVAARRGEPGTMTIEAWNGTSSRDLATVTGTITSLEVVDGRLYVIGLWHEPPDAETRIATLAAGVLRPRDEGLGAGQVTGLASVGTQLLALGTFPGGVAVRDGDRWVVVETGIESGAGVHDLVSWDGHRVVTGSFTRVGFGAPVTGIALWNQEAARSGSDW